MRTPLIRRLAASVALALACPIASAATVPTPAHVVVVMEENHAFGEIIGSPDAPYINRLAAQGALFTQSYALSHPSLPNYLQLFSGSNQGVTDDSEPHAFTTPNLGAALLASGRTFVGYGEDLPSVGSLALYPAHYDRDHCPWTQWQDAPSNGIPAADNRPFSDFPTDFTQLPTVAFVTPNLLDIMHDGTIAVGDAWLHDHMDGYVRWAKTHDSLLILRFDEDDGTDHNRIAMVFVGAMVQTGSYAERNDHYSVLRTIEDMYGLPPSGAAATATPITDCWTTTTSATPPSITAQPQSARVVVGQTATFTVAATGSATLAYRWQRDGADIAGATAASYTTPATTLADDGATFRVVVADAAGSATSSSATLSVTSPTTGPVTPLHYAANHNFAADGTYTPAACGFNLADVSSVAELDALPAGVQGLVYLGLNAGADADFVATVTPFIGHAKLFGFYLMDEPDPTGQWAPPTTPANLLAESDWIHAHVPGAKTFIVMMDLGSFSTPSFAGSYTPANTHIDLFGLDPYPCRTSLSSPDYALIDRTVAAATASGIPVDAIVPVYQAFGLGDWSDDLGGKYAMPTSDEERRILARWGALVPHPVFDMAYSWGAQQNDESLEGSSALQAVFAEHDGAGTTTGGTTSGGTTTGGTTAGATTGGSATGSGSRGGGHGGCGHGAGFAAAAALAFLLRRSLWRASA